MTREEAIYCMKSYINDDSYEHCVNCPYYAKNNLDSNIYVCESRTAHEMAIKALEQEPREDCISRKEVLELLEDTDNGWIINEVLQMPSVTSQKPKTDALDKIRAEIIDTGAYEQEVNGRTEFLKGINYCLGVIDKYKAEKE